jgi:hypothetical protein
MVGVGESLTFDVPGLADVEGRVDEDLEEGQVEVLVYLARHHPVLLEGRDEAAEAYLSAVGEELGDLSDPAYVLLAVDGTEAEVAVQARAHVVAVEAVGRYPEVHEDRLDLEGDRGLPGPGESRQPDGAAAEAPHGPEDPTALHPGHVVRLEGDVRAGLQQVTSQAPLIPARYRVSSIATTPARLSPRNLGPVTGAITWP